MSLLGPFILNEQVVIRIGHDDFMPGRIDQIRRDIQSYVIKVDQTYDSEGLARGRPRLVVPFSSRFELFRGTLR